MKSRNRYFPNIIPTIFLIVMIIALCTGCIAHAAYEEEEDKKDVLPTALYIESSLTAQAIEFVETKDQKELSDLIKDCKNRKDAAHSIAQGARVLGYSEEHPIIKLAKEEWHNAYDTQLKYEETYTKLFYDIWADAAEEYPIATKVWIYLKDLGYNDYVCAGIMGNMMAECGGQTLNLRWDARSPGGTFYGICQWSNLFFSQMHGTDLDAQLEFLKSNIEEEFNTFGYAYRSGFNYEKFLQMEDASDAALAFAKVYERCGSASYSVRQRNADKAYNYFIG